MPFAGELYSEISAGAYQIDDMLKDFKGRLDFAQQEPGNILSAMTAFGVEWGPIVDVVNAMALARPEDISVQNLQSHVANLLADYGTLVARCNALNAAVTGI